jgi:hypothetical protein
MGGLPYITNDTIAQLEPLAKLAGYAFGLFTAWKAVDEFRASRLERKRKLDWNHTKKAIALFDRLENNPLIKATTIMLDWNDRPFLLPVEGKKVTINLAEVLHALRLHNRGKPKFSAKEVYIRDCFDALFTYLMLVENAIRANFVDAAIMQSLLAYYIGKMANNKKVFQCFMDEYHDPLALAFAERIPKWREEGVKV